MKKWVENPLLESTKEWLLPFIETDQLTVARALELAFSIGVLSMGPEYIKMKEKKLWETA
ncbi:hypothetical protein LCGC14_2109930 [marine sediment metagenome]|uniref:Uncharacterized protein n=1 Tax=marine sediment metagenome TaxID=412755 RepID=A0A0F9H3S6_9ZZZZ